VFVVGNGHILSELGRISRSLTRKTERKKYYGGKIKSEFAELNTKFSAP